MLRLGESKNIVIKKTKDITEKEKRKCEAK